MLEEECLESSPVEKDLGMLLDRGEHEPLCVQTAKETKGILACIRNGVSTPTGRG